MHILFVDDYYSWYMDYNEKFTKKFQVWVKRMTDSVGDILDVKVIGKPTKRSEFGLCNDNNNMVYIYGGFNGFDSYLDDFYFVNGMCLIYLVIFWLINNMFYYNNVLY